MSDGPSLRVLIVEDHIALAENLSEFLSHKHFILDFASDGLTGLHLAATNTYDIIVLDVMLPGIDGFQLCHRLRRDLKLTTPIIMLTAKDALARRSQRRHEGLQAGDLCYFPGTLLLQAEDGSSCPLTGIGATLVEILIRAYPNYVKHQSLIEQIWDGEADSHTLRTHIYTLRKHLSTHFGRGLIRSVHGKGYCFSPEPEPR